MEIEWDAIVDTGLITCVWLFQACYTKPKAKRFERRCLILAEAVATGLLDSMLIYLFRPFLSRSQVS